MKKNPKISFLIPAHNEEKIISKTLDSLMRLPYPNYEVILGLDGCTDKTEEIAKKYSEKSKKFRYYVLNLRQGKPAVINSIIKKARGDIVIIQDADWIFHAKNKRALEKFVSAFDDLRVGGIAESFPVQYPLRKHAGFLERGVMIQNKLWLDYLKGAGRKISPDWILADKDSHPLLVNIFRKSLYKPNKTLADDFERFRDIVRAGKNVLATNNPDLPRMITIGEHYTFRGIITQKERTAQARKQLSEKPSGRIMNSGGFLLYVIRETMAMGLRDIFSFFLVNLAFLIGMLKSKLKKPISTKEGWKMRLAR